MKKKVTRFVIAFALILGVGAVAYKATDASLNHQTGPVEQPVKVAYDPGTGGV